MKKKLDAYQGRLTPAQAAAGMNAAARNAQRLAKDAATLLAAGSFPTAASIAILSIEEAGKTSILRTLALSTSDADSAKEWKNYRSHTKKNVGWLLPQLAAAGARTLDDLQPLVDETSDHPYVLDQLKQLGFYTDCLGKGNWAIPSDVIDEKLARSLVEIARIFARDREYTEQEVRLWIQHIGPVWKKNPAWMKKALANWFAAMREAGLWSLEANEVEQFIGLGQSKKADQGQAS